MMSNLGFIGLGIMGSAMCRNLLKAGHTLVVHDLTTEPIDRMVALGATRGESSRDVAERSDIVITMLPDGPEVEQAVLGPDGVLEGARSGSTVIDMSSINPIVAQKVGMACAARSIRFLDAPVSGGEPKAVDATLPSWSAARSPCSRKWSRYCVRWDPASY
jgi:2-hydroxy-3-oxopropionate reductase